MNPNTPPFVRSKFIVRGLRTIAYTCILVGLASQFGADSLVYGATAAPFVQKRDQQITSGASNSLAFNAQTTAGNLIAVYVIWDNKASVSVSDSAGNTYATAIGPSLWNNGVYSTQVFYAKNIVGGADTVTARFSTAIRKFGIIYIHEYSLLDPVAPVDVTTAAIGNSGSLNSGLVATSSPNDLLFGAGVSMNVVTAAGTGYTARDMAMGNITEDRVVTTQGTYNATAPNSAGGWGMQMVAFRFAGGTVNGDTAPPSAPTGLTATPASTTQINLAWAASSDSTSPQAQIKYQVYRNGTLVGTTAAGVTSWQDAGLTAATTYTYFMKAQDAAGNVSGQSTSAQATTTASPTVNIASFTSSPASITAGQRSTLSWSVSNATSVTIDNGIGNVAASGSVMVSPSVTTTYTLTATNSGGSKTARTSVTVSSATDTQSPSVSITSPSAGQTVSGAVNVVASATDNVGVSGVQFMLDGASLGQESFSSPYSTSWNTAGASSGTHVLTAVAYDAAGNSATSPGVTVTVNKAGAGTGNNYTTNFPLSENPISEGGKWINGRTNGLDWADVSTTTGKAFGTESGSGGYDDSTAILAGSWGPDQTAQAIVFANQGFVGEVELRLRSAITAHRNTGYEINFSSGYCQVVRWEGPLGSFTMLANNTGASVKNGDVVKATITGNEIVVYINGSKVNDVTDSTFTSGAPGIGFYNAGAGNSPNNAYGFSTYTATDNGSGSGSGTQSKSDVAPPTAPTQLSASAVSSSQINLSWTASTDDVGVAGYQVFRNNTQIANTSATSFSDVGLTTATQYTYTVAAFDAAGHVSDQSVPVTATTLVPDSMPPSVPGNLQSSNVTSSSLTISWTASTDDVAVAGYQIFRNGTQIGTTTSATNYTDKGLTAGTTYAYTVAAFDASNNTSAQSTQILVTTTTGPNTPPSFIQVNQNEISSGTKVATGFNSSTTAGNTIVAYVIWSNTGSVTLTDSRGDTFVSAQAPTLWAGKYNAQVFYATNVAGGADTVTATFSTSVSSFGVLYVHEYSGISTTNPVDVTLSASGSSSLMNTGNAVTTSPNDLIFAAGVSDNVAGAAGSGFTARDLAYGNVTEDRSAVTPGTYNATAPNQGKAWGIQLVAFRGAQ